eukprot:2792931-Pleurochrysis_carterae.AAC.1
MVRALTKRSKCECVEQIFEFLNPIICETLRVHSRRFLGGDILGEFDFAILPFSTDSMFSYDFAFEMSLSDFGIRSDKNPHPRTITADVVTIAN